MTQKSLYQISLFYLAIPIFIFFAGWITPFISFPFLAASGLTACYGWKTIQDDRTIPRKELWIILVIAFAWCYFAGLSGFYYQSDDYHYRNAVLRDLITHDWPVYFNSFDGALVYYIAHWMVPALAGKTALWTGLSDINAWHVANIVLYVWSSFGVSLVLGHLYLFWTPKKAKTFFALTGMFVFFSGMDVWGTLWYNVLSEHIEWWAGLFQYSSFTTCLFWVFNQTIAPWLIIMMLVTQKRVQDMAVLGVLCFFYAPLPAIGLFPFLALWGIQALKKEENWMSFIKKALSAQNIVATLICLPLFFAFLSVNQTIQEEQNGLRWALTYPWAVKMYFVFLLLEGGILIALLSKSFYKNVTFYVMTALFILIPLLRIGTASNDFAMRVSIPALFILMLFTGIALTDKNVSGIRKILIIICLLIGAVTPTIEFYRGFHHIYQEKRIVLPADNIHSFESYQGQEVFKNFFVAKPEETLFFSTFTRTKPQPRK